MTTSKARAWIAFGMLSVTIAMLVGGVMLIWAIVTGDLTRTAAAALSPARSGIWIRSREIGH